MLRIGRELSLRKAIVGTGLLAVTLIAGATSTLAQRPRHKPAHKPAEAAAPPISIDKRDSVVMAAGPFDGRPYWLALAQCGGIYFKLNVLYTDAAVHARVVKPDPHADADLPRSSTKRSTSRPRILTAPSIS
jgi:hypothetical protein